MSLMEDDKPEANAATPGQTIQPGGATVSAPAPPAQPATEVQQPQAVEEDDSDDMADGELISWTASEFIEHAKTFDWYLALGVVAVLVSGALYLFWRDVITSLVVLVVAFVLGFYGRRQPRQLRYALDSHGLTIDSKYFPYAIFRSFAVMDEGHFDSIVFTPLKRFGLLTTIYFDPADEERIIELINQYLPLEPRNHDPIDRFMKRIRF